MKHLSFLLPVCFFAIVSCTTFVVDKDIRNGSARADARYDDSLNIDLPRSDTVVFYKSDAEESYLSAATGETHVLIGHNATPDSVATTKASLISADLSVLDSLRDLKKNRTYQGNNKPLDTTITYFLMLRNIGTTSVNSIVFVDNLPDEVTITKVYWSFPAPGDAPGLRWNLKTTDTAKLLVVRLDKAAGIKPGSVLRLELAGGLKYSEGQ
jgi:uncharacterized repeat protein (TIGR01451 family)